MGSVEEGAQTALLVANETQAPDAKPCLLVFSLAGRLGSGASFVGRNLRDELYAYRYNVITVDVSVLIMLSLLDEDVGAGLEGDEFINRITEKFQETYKKPEERTEVLQDHGNKMREEYGNDILARLAVSCVIARHLKGPDGVASRQAFILDSLKRPEEVDYLRRVFGSAFFCRWRRLY